MSQAPVIIHAKQMKRKKNIQRNVLDLALERLHYLYDRFDHLVVSFSGGKDSTVCLNLTLQVARERGKLPLRVYFFDEEAIPYQTEEYMRRVAAHPDIALEWYCLPVQHRNACSRLHPFWSPWDPACPDLWVRPLPPEGRTQLTGFNTEGTPATRRTIPKTQPLLCPPTLGLCGVIMGIRASESLTRTKAILHKRHDEHFTVPYHEDHTKDYRNIWKCYPIYDWKTEDVWTAPNLFGWDYNQAYDVMEQFGVPQHQQRCSPAYGEEPMQGFYRFRACFPEIWDKMSTRVPGANTAYYYAKSQIYGYGEIPPKPDDVTWEEYLLHYLLKFAPEGYAIAARKLRKAIVIHYGKTTDPILAKVPHPITGLSWDTLAKMAIRGDFKERRVGNVTSRVSTNPDGTIPPEAWEAYNRARTEEGL